MKAKVELRNNTEIWEQYLEFCKKRTIQMLIINQSGFIKCGRHDYINNLLQVKKELPMAVKWNLSTNWYGKKAKKAHVCAEDIENLIFYNLVQCSRIIA